MPKPTKTTNKLHFEDLDPIRFEDLAVALLDRDRKWAAINHDGRTGGDGGVDIRATDRLDDGTMVFWAVQCKRYSTFSAANARRVVDDLLLHGHVPDVLLLVTACSVSAKARGTLDCYAKAKGVKETKVWSASELEASLYNRHPDLLFVYFGERSRLIADEPHPADIRLMQEYRRRITPAEHSFLASHDFGNPVRHRSLSTFGEIDDVWRGVRFEFFDDQLRPLFAEVLARNRAFMALTVERLFMSDVSEEILTPKNDIDRRQGLTPTTRQAIRDMNDAAHGLLRAMETFERAASGKIRIA